MSDENSILIDWFSATTTAYDVTTLVEALGLSLDDFTPLPGCGRYFFANRYQCGHIKIYTDYILSKTNTNYFGGIMLEMSGQGCREFEGAGCSFDKLFQAAEDGLFNVTRLDVAYDDIDHDGSGLLDIGKVVRYTYRQRFVTKWGKLEIVDSCKLEKDPEGKMQHAASVTFGSRQSDLLLRIYDKAAERGGLDYHWVRAEMQLRRERAQEFIHQYMTSRDIGHLYCGVLKNYLRFINNDATRRERCSVVGWWEKFLNNVEKIRLYTPHDPEYNLEKMVNTCINQYGNTIEATIRAEGIDVFVKQLTSRRSKLNPKQRQVIEDQQRENQIASDIKDKPLRDIIKGLGKKKE